MSLGDLTFEGAQTLLFQIVSEASQVLTGENWEQHRSDKFRQAKWRLLLSSIWPRVLAELPRRNQTERCIHNLLRTEPREARLVPRFFHPAELKLREVQKVPVPPKEYEREYHLSSIARKP